MSEPRREYRKVATVLAEQATAGGTIQTLEGEMTFEAGDYICGPGQGGEFWPVKRSIFEATYVPAEAAAQAGDLDTAWRDAEAALPEGWWIHDLHAWSFDDMAYRVEAATAGSHYWAGTSKREKMAGTRHYAPGPTAFAFGPTPADALRALAARLRERSE